jgi:ABC-type lipoprotein export system ATPase subunit/GNAT superfamily N-acetyltransferase
MRHVDVKVSTRLESTPRVKQLSGMFDVPAREKLEHHWQTDLPLDEQRWQIGLIVGPSGSGKSTIARHLFGEPARLEWTHGSVCDDFDSKYPIQDIADICSAVGFNTIPSWLKPFAVLSTGEKFRVELARHLLEGGDEIMIDEFTSVVDRQVAHIGCHAVQKYIRRREARRLVAVTCHYDVIDWLQPDWMLEPATMTFQWRSLCRRPGLSVEISATNYESWRLFAPFHYLTADLHRGARCFVLFVDGAPASFGAVLHRPHPRAHNIKGLSRLVTLPDYQGLGLAMILSDALGAAYKTIGWRFHTYPAHPSLVRSFDKSKNYEMQKMPGKFSQMGNIVSKTGELISRGGRPCAVFEYCGPAMPASDATALLSTSFGKEHAPGIA